MTEEWFTYSDLGERLGISSEAARQKAIRYRWPRRTANDGKAQVRVDLEEVKASTYPRRSKDDQLPDDRPTPDELPSDTRTIAALDAHIETLKAMVVKAEAIADRERTRADSERARADVERARADGLVERIEEVLTERRKGADDQRQTIAGLEEQIQQLRGMVELARRPWWRRLAG
ncbi:hypothetical protein [Microvirga mediterraneensis]|uniref:Uncharacterized protein n=1 Tax=Microvirga mediterraneensis TaxID=2754695 RepID=A0A838BVF4_9HYPH|nr:hypothetical protein [Microvirga mediterraneensis]MBA1159411.1 hypothetical protein [Microvirga mediterraneensis]